MVRAAVSGLSIEIRGLQVRVLPVASVTVAQWQSAIPGAIPCPHQILQRNSMKRRGPIDVGYRNYNAPKVLVAGNGCPESDQRTTSRW
jgi:hypothetical protein